MPSNASRYAQLKRRLWLIDWALTVGFLGGMVASGWGVCLRSWVMAHFTGWMIQVAVYVGFLGIGGSIAGLPLDWFGSFFLEHRFGLSTQRFRQWLWEYLKRFLVGGVLGLIVVEGLAALLRTFGPAGRFGPTWWVWAAFFWMGWSILLTRVAPAWLIPIFYRQRELSDPSLRDRLDSFLRRSATPVRGIFEVDLSRTTRKANACLCGLGKTRRVLVSDTLARTYPPEEVEVVLAHEVGHHRGHHLGILIVTSTIAAGASCFAVNEIARGWILRLGLAGLTDLAALPLIGLGLFLAGSILMPITNGLSRWLEAQADRFALEATRNPQAFIATMRRLAEQNLAEWQPPRWVEWLLYDHPPIAKRIAMAEQWRK